ncbi:DUF459 domain-containing protein [uncultured Rhodoblastus sp.]|uniref:SGNH/GDSL hydrolase family protein n=1 Tax=uncultured Rhodoblastus sp. TaxID=543037 RepID=UPI0025D773E6|nr:DUF459 domain-containing protein [uncultured Rhodoblastus sp.]
MPHPPRQQTSRSRLVRAGLALVLAALLIGPAGAPPAQAQDAVSDFFSSLFGGHRAPQPRPQKHRPAHRPKPAARATPNPAPSSAAPAGRAGPAVARPAPSFFVAVIGDSEAGLLAQGLAEAFAGDPRVAIVNKTRQDTGLVRDDFYDWPKAAAALLEGPQHFDLAVIQIGINDNQKLRVEGGIEPLSKPFNDIYAKRVEEVASAFRDKNVPLVWVGLPIMRSETLSAAALVFNDIDRQYAGALGARYVDLWEAFSDVNSTYKASGPDIDGDIVRLRAADGVHFNKAGARKAAHFVEPEIRRVLEAALQPAKTPLEAPPAAPGESAPSLSPVPGEAEGAPQSSMPPQPAEAATPAPPKPLAGKIEALTEPAVSPGGALAETPLPAAPIAAPTQPGRADDFRWTGK